MGSEIFSSNPVVKAILDGTAPRPAQLAAARGALPLPQGDLLEILVNLSSNDDPELKAAAEETLSTQALDTLEATIRSGVAPSVLAHLSGRDGMPQPVMEAILANPDTPSSAIAALAARSRNGGILDVISFNQQLLIKNPEILDALLANPSRTPDAERRAAEIKREFFEKERGAQQIANELRAQGNEAAAEFLESAEFADSIDTDGGLSLDDALFIAQHIEVPDRETDDSWLSLEYIEEIYEESEEQRQAILSKILGEMQADDEASSERVSMLNRIMRMGVKDRVKLAMKGDREARNILIRDPNKLVSTAVVNNPRITEKEVENIAAMRSISEDILRQLATNRQWGRSYPIMHNLARNPRLPIANAITIMNRLQLRDLVALSKNRNVSDAVRRQALRLHVARTGGGSRG